MTIVDMARGILRLFSGHGIRERICGDYGLDDKWSQHVVLARFGRCPNRRNISGQTLRS